MIELFRSISELDNHYQISNFGRVRRKERQVKSSVSPSGFRILKERGKFVIIIGYYKRIYERIQKEVIDVGFRIERVLKRPDRNNFEYFIFLEKPQ